MAGKDDFKIKDAIQAVADANDGVNFYEKICTAIDKSTDVQKKIKGLIWWTVRDKFYIFLFALIILLGSNFLIGLANEWGQKVGQSVFDPATQTGISTTTKK